ncbi:MAG: hypothetical protein MUP55_03880 [Candidatus Aenigmarchaeota archaeon]|nr:hypothetical protein [Candidatus Aenigmarchaeota archaeon]
MPKKISELPPGEQKFIKNFVSGMCAFLSSCPPSQPKCDPKRATDACVLSAMADEEKLIKKFGEPWRMGIANALGLKAAQSLHAYDTMTPEERGRRAWQELERALDRL